MGDGQFLAVDDGLRRSRCAILFADLVESVQHYALDEALAIERWRGLAQQARGPWMENMGGRLVRTDGDGLLLEFPNAGRAVCAAFELHQAMSALNRAHPGAKAMELRVGMHVADVVFDPYEAFGAGVNLAKRVTTLAQPGETLVSDTARDGLVDGLHAIIEDQGLRFVKHLEAPVRTFRVKPLGQATGSHQRATVAMSDDLRPTLAVVPFVVMQAEAAQDALGHAVADDVIAALSRHPGLRVVSRLSTAAFRDTSLDWTHLRELLGAGFVLSGRCYVSGARFRLSLELAETSQGQVLWADTLRAEVQAVFEGQDELVPMVVRQVAQQVAAHELTRVRSLPMDTLQSYALYLGAEGLMSSLVQRDFNRAREALEHLAERHPRQAMPRALLARWHVNNIVQRWSGSDRLDESRGLQWAQQALDIDERNPAVLASAGLARLNLKSDLLGARKLFEASLQLNAQNPTTWAWMSAVHCYCQEFEAARTACENALALSPLDPERYLFESYAAMTCLASASYPEAVAHAQQSLRLHALHAPSHYLLTAGLWLAGEREQARQAAQRLLSTFQKPAASGRTAKLAGTQSPWRERLAQALREAGLP